MKIGTFITQKILPFDIAEIEKIRQILEKELGSLIENYFIKEEDNNLSITLYFNHLVSRTIERNPYLIENYLNIYKMQILIYKNFGKVSEDVEDTTTQYSCSMWTNGIYHVKGQKSRYDIVNDLFHARNFNTNLTELTNEIIDWLRYVEKSLGVTSILKH